MAPIDGAFVPAPGNDQGMAALLQQMEQDPALRQQMEEDSKPSAGFMAMAGTCIILPWLGYASHSDGRGMHHTGR
eukprot:gene11921-biopygen6940